MKCMGLQPRSARRFRKTLAAVVGSLALAFAWPAASPAAPGDVPWRSVGGIITSSADMAELPDGGAYLVARGMDGAAWLHVLESGDNIHQGTWSSLGGQILGGPAITSTMADETAAGTGRLDVFAQGTDNALWTRSFMAADGVWTPWTSLGGILTAEPAALAFGDPDDASPPSNLRIAVFVRGADGAMWRRELLGTSGWNDWSSLGGGLVSGPGAGGHPTSFIGTVAVRGTDNAAWYLTYDGETGGVSPWFSGGGNLNAGPAAEFFCSPALWARGTNDAVWHAIDPPNGWISYGGRAKSGPGTHVGLTFPFWFVVVRGNDDALWLNADQVPDTNCAAATAYGSGSTRPAPAWMEELR